MTNDYICMILHGKRMQLCYFHRRQKNQTLWLVVTMHESVKKNLTTAVHRQPLSLKVKTEYYFVALAIEQISSLILGEPPLPYSITDHSISAHKNLTESMILSETANKEISYIFHLKSTELKSVLDY